MLDPILVELARTQRLLRGMLAHEGDGDAVGPSHLAVLEALTARPRMTGADLARAASITPQAMNEVVRRLEQADEVTRSPHPVDKRKVEYQIRPAGRALVKKTHATQRRLDEHLARTWSEERQTALLDELRAVNADLEGALKASDESP